MKYLIIGNSAAGIGGAEGIRKHDLKGNITIISDEHYHTYSRPLISYYLASQVDFNKMKYRPDDFYVSNNINCKLGKKVININNNKNFIEINDGQKITYDRLLIATGGKTIVPPIEGYNKSNIYNFLNINDAKSILNQIKELNFGKAVILGAGLIGLKAAEALVKKGLEVKVVELSKQVLSSILDKKAAEIIKNHLEKKGIEFYFNDTIQEFTGDEMVDGVRLKSGIELKCDLGIIAIGVKPNISIVKDTEIKINKGIMVNEHMKSNIDNIYAAGDVCEGYDMLTGSTNTVPIWPNAYSQGYIAGQNMAGVSKDYQRSFTRNSIGFFGLPLITAGIINPSSEEKDIYEDYQKESVMNKTYSKVIIKNNKLVGYILINKVDRAGILTGLIKNENDINDIKNRILDDDFGYLTFSKEYRDKNLYKEVAYASN